MSRRARAGFALLVGLLAAPACKPRDPDSCAAVAEHYQQVLEREVARDYSGAKLQDAMRGLPVLAEELQALCEKEKWTQRHRRCHVRADSVAAFSACEHEPPKR